MSEKHHLENVRFGQRQRLTLEMLELPQSVFNFLIFFAYELATRSEVFADETWYQPRDKSHHIQATYTKSFSVGGKFEKCIKIILFQYPIIKDS